MAKGASKNQQRDKNGRFAKKGGGSSFASRGLAALGALRSSGALKTGATVAAGAAAVGGAAYLASRMASRGQLKSSEAGGGPKLLPAGPSASKAVGPKPRSKTMRIGGGVKLAPKELDTILQTVEAGIGESRNHGLVARSYQQVRTAKSLETKGMLKRQAHPKGASDSDKRHPHFVPTDAAITALKKAGHLTSERAMEWRNNWQKPGRDL